jgi:hypothetical protein
MPHEHEDRTVRPGFHRLGPDHCHPDPQGKGQNGDPEALAEEGETP